jgi:hypothetical protein
MARPKTGVTPVRNIRIGEDLWRAAQVAAADHDETVTAVIERALTDYVKKHKREQARAAQD